MYDREIAGRVLSFEASGALMQATLVLRDRETDSWWSIMTSGAIGGELEGTDLVELPVATKTTWGVWRARYPGTLVLSIGGREHEPRDGYADYWNSPRTFRDLEVDDQRLTAKEPIFAFTLDGRALAAAHRDFAGGRLFALGESDPRRVFLFRPAGASVRASSRALLVPATVAGVDGAAAGETLLERLLVAGARPLAGFDTYWYSWATIHPGTRLLPTR